MTLNHERRSSNNLWKLKDVNLQTVACLIGRQNVNQWTVAFLIGRFAVRTYLKNTKER